MKGAARRSGDPEWPRVAICNSQLESERRNRYSILTGQLRVSVRPWVAWSRDVRVRGRYLNTVCRMGKASFVDQYVKSVSVQLSQEKIYVPKTPYRTEIFRIASKLVCNKAAHTVGLCSAAERVCIVYNYILSNTRAHARTHTHTHTHTRTHARTHTHTHTPKTTTTQQQRLRRQSCR